MLLLDRLYFGTKLAQKYISKSDKQDQNFAFLKIRKRKSYLECLNILTIKQLY
jgi:hypothetical protein